MTTRLQKRYSRRPRCAHALAAVAAACSLALGSCEQVTCPLNNTVAADYVFYASERDDDGSLSATPSAVTIADTLTVTILGTDVVLLNKWYGQSAMSLPVSYYAGTDSLLLRFASADGLVGYDTIYMHKHSYTHFDDPSCPVHVWHRIEGVESTRHLIDTVAVMDAAITYDSGTNVAIYVRTQ